MHLSSPRDKNIVPLAHFKTHLSRWVFVFISREQLNLPVRASEVIFDSEVHFVSEVSPIGEVANLTSLEAKPQTSLCYTQLHFCQRQKLHLFPIISEHSGLATPKSPLNLTFTSSKNTKPIAFNLSSTIIKRRESASLLVSERVQIALRTFCEKQNRVRSTASQDAKFA